MFPDMRGTGRVTGPRSIFGRVVAAILAVGALVIGLMFSVFVFAAALVAGIVLFGWIWWKMRSALRQARQDPRFQQFRDAMQGSGSRPGDGKIIEGEVLHEEWKDPPR